MGKIQTTNVLENEILKAVDMNNAFDAQINNLAYFTKAIFDTQKDFVIGTKELVKAQSELENDWSILVEPIFGISKFSGELFLNTESQIVGIPHDKTNVKVLVEISGELVETDVQQRTFIDFDTKATSIIPVKTKKILEPKVQCLTDGTLTVPHHTDGWVKLAEIEIPAGATKISDCIIKNITSDNPSGINTDWEEEKNATFNMGFISDINSRFNNEHDAEGKHKSHIIKPANLDAGTGSSQINGKTFVTGKTITLNESEIPFDTSLTDIIESIAGKVSDIFTNYMKYGKYNYKGEIGISNQVENNALLNAIKIGAAGDGSAYIKIADKELLKITQNGNSFSIEAGTGYSATKDNDFTTKTDVKNLIVVDDVPTENSNNSVKSGGVYSAIKIVETEFDNYIPTGDIEQTVTESIYKIPSSNALINKLKGYTKKWVGTQAQYDEITTKDPDTFYCITDAFNTLIDDNEIAEDTTYSSEKIEQLVADVQGKLTFDDVPTQGSNNPVKSGGIYDSIETKQNKLPAATNPGDVLTLDENNNPSWQESQGGNGAFVTLTKAEYDALEIKDPDVYYSIIDDEATTGIINDTESKANQTYSSNKIENKFTNKSELINLIYPVGSIYMSVNNVSPGTFLGGKWEALTDKFLVGAGSTYAKGATGGNASVTLTTNHLPQHSHTINSGNTSSSGTKTTAGFRGVEGTIASSGGHAHTYHQNLGYGYGETNHTNSIGSGYGNWYLQSNSSVSVGGDGSHTHKFTPSGYLYGATDNEGKATPTAVDTLPPYLAVYMWKRTE